MKSKRYQMAVFFLVFLALLLGENGYGQENERITTMELQEVVDLIEDPNKRAVLVKTLKTIIQAKEAPTVKDDSKSAKPTEEKRRELLIIERFFSEFESLSTKVIMAA